jgi:hypothetical protein
MRKGERLLDRVQTMLQRDTLRRLKLHARQGHVLARYRTTAEARRQKALRRWIAEIAKRTQSESQAA